MWCITAAGTIRDRLTPSHLGEAGAVAWACEDCYVERKAFFSVPQQRIENSWIAHKVWRGWDCSLYAPYLQTMTDSRQDHIERWAHTSSVFLQKACALRAGKISNKRKRIFPIIERDGPYCVWCSHDLDQFHAEASIDHLIPRSLLSSLTKPLLGDNLVLACRTCNSERGVCDANQWIDICTQRGQRVRTRQILSRLQGEMFFCSWPVETAQYHALGNESAVQE